MGIQVNEYYELLALHRALMEAKFVDVARSPEVSGSPFVARLARRVVQSLMELEEGRKGALGQHEWTRWLQMDSNRREWQVALNRTREYSDWSYLSHDERLTIAGDLLAPFEVTEEQLLEFVTESLEGL